MPEAGWVNVDFEDEDGDEVGEVWVESDGSLWGGPPDEGGEELELLDDEDDFEDHDLYEEVSDLRDSGVPVSPRYEYELIDAADRTGDSVEETHAVMKGGLHPVRDPIRRRQIEFAQVWANEDGEVLDDYGRPQKLADLDDDTPERLDWED
jgi:hypothetical protein